MKNKKKFYVIAALCLLMMTVCGFVFFNERSPQRYYPLKLFSIEELGLNRGPICDVNGETLVMSQPAYTLLAEPKKFGDRMD